LLLTVHTLRSIKPILMDTTQFTSSLRRTPSTLRILYKTLSPERVVVFWSLVGLSVILLFSALIAWNARFLTTVPTYGGSIKEGIVGTPRFINPVLATSEQDRDLTALVFAGLMKKDSEGNTQFDMAESIEESEDGLHYNVILKPTATFHNGEDVTADDIIYTVNLIQNPNIKSPFYVRWEGVTMEKISDKELIFSLKKPYPLFMDTLTQGILPKNIWKNLTDEQFSLSDYNINAVGSGPYKIEKIESTSGIPHTIKLAAHKDYTLGRPYIDTVSITAYQNDKYALQAFDNGDIDRIHGMSPEGVRSLGLNTSAIHTSLLPRTITVFFNPNRKTVLSDKNVRQALQMAIDKDEIVRTVLLDYGKVINAPYPFDEEVASSTYNVEQAKKLLASTKTVKSGGAITITLATANTEEMKKVAEMIKIYWEAVGVQTTLAIYEVSDLNQSVIKDRNFEALLFGSITESPADLYAFWHSSQRTYPGLNISNYVSSKLDKNLETLRTDEDPLSRATAYDDVRKEFADEVPGIFLYAPQLIYITRDKVTTIMPQVSYDNSSRFALIESWHRYTERVWPKTYYKQVIQAVENIIH
jgi:peptide/nickel transport system substrate-binding protein